MMVLEACTLLMMWSKLISDADTLLKTLRQLRALLAMSASLAKTMQLARNTMQSRCCKTSAMHLSL